MSVVRHAEKFFELLNLVFHGCFTLLPRRVTVLSLKEKCHQFQIGGIIKFDLPFGKSVRLGAHGIGMIGVFDLQKDWFL